MSLTADLWRADHKTVLRAPVLRAQEWRNPLEGTDSEESGKGERQVKCLSAHLPHMGKNHC